MLKKVVCILCAGFLFVGTALADVPVLIESDNGSVVLDVPEPAYIEDGTTMVPLRALCEALGCTVDWDDATQGIAITKGETVVGLTIGSTAATVNGAARTVLPPVLKNGTAMIPLRFVSESFGCDVQYCVWEGREEIRITPSRGIASAILADVQSRYGVASGMPLAEAKQVLGYPITDEYTFLGGYYADFGRLWLFYNQFEADCPVTHLVLYEGASAGGFTLGETTLEEALAITSYKGDVVRSAWTDDGNEAEVIAAAERGEEYYPAFQQNFYINDGVYQLGFYFTHGVLTTLVVFVPMD